MTTNIQWTDEVWNPTVGCSRVSAGCENCYAERVAHRGMTPHHAGLTVMGKHGPRWMGEVRLRPGVLGKPLQWRKPRRVFVDSMSDLFHPAVPFEFIAAVFGVMAACPQHTFQILTKRPERMLEWFAHDSDLEGEVHRIASADYGRLFREDADVFALDGCGPITYPDEFQWPLPNVLLGVSAEDQEAADQRIPLLLRCPAAVRWVSVEPLLGAVNLCAVPDTKTRPVWFSARATILADLDWVVVGGESGPGARPCNVEWIRSIVEQCKGAGVACFVKQLGSAPIGLRGDVCDRCFSGFKHVRHGLDCPKGNVLNARKGGDPNEWPADLRVREFPEACK